MNCATDPQKSGVLIACAPCPRRRSPFFVIFQWALPLELLVLDGIGRPEVTARSWKRILVPLDGSREAEEALPEALRLAKKTGARIDLVGVRPRYVPVPYGYAPYLPKVEDRMPYLSEIAKYVEFEEVAADARAFEGDPAREILRYAEESGADLICLTSRKRTWSPAGWASTRARYSANVAGLPSYPAVPYEIEPASAEPRDPLEYARSGSPRVSV